MNCGLVRVTSGEGIVPSLLKRSLSVQAKLTPSNSEEKTMPFSRFRKIALAAATLAVPFLTSAARAAYPTDLMTFDTSASMTNTPSSSFGYNPTTVPNFRFDNGTLTAGLHHSVSWTGAQDNTGNSGGAVQFNWTWSHTSDGDGSSAFDMDLTGAGVEPTISQLSFDIKVDASSAQDTFGGYGYFQVFTRNDSYSYDGTPNDIVNGVNVGANGWELGNPTYGGPTDNTWAHVVIPFSTPVSPRALVFQDYNDSGRNINGALTYYIDNVQLTPVAVPEPASLAFLGLGIPALLVRRRAKTA
jgi:hypothetical protein